MTKVEELRAELMESVEGWLCSIEGEWSVDLTHEKVAFEKVLDSLISARVTEGIDQMRATIMAEGKLYPRFSAIFPSMETKLGIVSPEYEIWVIPASVLTPKER